MKKFYTKEQIIEAIKYWESFLKNIDESNNKLLTQLINKYGNDLVLNKMPFKIDNKIAYELFTLFNNSIFNSALPNCEILCESYEKIVIELKCRKSDIPSNKFYGMFNTIVEDENLKSLTDKLKYRDDLIILNTSLLNNSNFIFICSTLCHEMIHLYGKIYGEESLCDKYWLLFKININSHTTPTFKKFKRKINNMGLTIIDDAAGLDFSELSSEAFINMLNYIINDGVNLDEDDDNNLNNKTIISNKISNNATSLSHVDYI